MNIAIGSDHHGVSLRGQLVDFLQHQGHEVQEFGPSDEAPEPTDYPDVAGEVASRVSRGEADRGILICGTGIGMAIAANKFRHVRAAPVADVLSAEISRRHNDLNVLCLAGDHCREEIVDELVKTWLETPFEGGRHCRRVEKIGSIEDEVGKE